MLEINDIKKSVDSRNIDYSNDLEKTIKNNNNKIEKILLKENDEDKKIEEIIIDKIINTLYVNWSKVCFKINNVEHELCMWKFIYENEKYYNIQIESNWYFIHNFYLDIPKNFLDIIENGAIYWYWNNPEILISKFIPSDNMKNILLSRELYDEKQSENYINKYKNKIHDIIDKIYKVWVQSIIENNLNVEDVLWKNYDTYSLESAIFYTVKWSNYKWNPSFWRKYYWSNSDKSEIHTNYVNNILYSKWLLKK